MSQPLPEGTGNIPVGTIVMIIDEFGDLGATPKDPTKKRRRKYFGYAVSITDNPEGFAGLTDDNRTKHRELKAWKDSPEGKKKIAEGIAGMNVDARAYYVDKDNPPKGWKGKGSGDMNRLFRYSVKESLPKEGKVLVIVDRHSSLGDVDRFLKEQSKDKLKVRGDKYDSNSGPYSELLQTHDYVAYAAGIAKEHNDRSLSDIIGIKFPNLKRRI